MNLRTFAGALGVVAVFAAGGFFGVRALRGGGGSQATTANYSDKVLSFDYPVAWHRKFYRNEGSFSSAIVFLSNAAMHDTCTTRKEANGWTLETCSMPVDQLEAEGVVIEWSANGLPGWTLERQAGIETVIAGRRAKVVEQPLGKCQGVSADITITAYISRDLRDNWYQMLACLKGPHLEELQRQISLMLESTKLVGG